MASFSSAPHHARSNSLPSTPNVVISQLDERLRSSESASSTTSSSIGSKLIHLTQIYECIDEFLQLPSSRKALSCQEKWIEDSLEGSIKIMDICTNISDVMVQMKERAQELQSILRRRCSEDEIAQGMAKYLKSRKIAIKACSKELKNLKKIESLCGMEMSDNVDVSRRLRESQMVTLNVLESALVSIIGPKAQASNWESVVAKVLKSKRVTSQQQSAFFVGFEAMDAKKVMSGLQKMEISMKDVEQGIECLFRHLIKTRTTILNC